MRDFPSINQVAILGLLTSFTPKPENLFKWQFHIQVPSNYSGRNAEAVLLCGASDKTSGESLQHARINKDHILVNGKLRKGGFVQVRDLSVIGEVKPSQPSIHHIALLGQITDISQQSSPVYKWQFNINVFREYGKTDGDPIEAVLTCGLGQSEYYDQLMNSSTPGQWATVQGKIRNSGFVQVRSICIFDLEKHSADE